MVKTDSQTEERLTQIINNIPETNLKNEPVNFIRKYVNKLEHGCVTESCHKNAVRVATRTRRKYYRIKTKLRT